MRFAHAILIALSLLAGCKKPEPAPALTVFAAASLRDAFTALETPFAAAHPGVKVTFNFAGSQELRTQIDHGAPADVFASADQKQMSGLAGSQVFAHNELAVVVASDARDVVSSWADLPKAERVVLGAAEVPVGRYALEVLGKAGDDFRSSVESHVVSRELNVKQVLAKVALGEAQAGIVYRTDVSRADAGVTVVEIPAELNVLAEYPIAVVAKAPHPELATAWVELVLSSQGRTVLQQCGFRP